jgi:tetratricopeptide (TPR) repeat protein
MKILLLLVLVLAFSLTVNSPQKLKDISSYSHSISQVELANESEETTISPFNTKPYEQEVSKHPTSSEAHYKLGKAYLNHPIFPDLIKARKALKRAIALKPDYAEAYNGLGLSYQGFVFGLVTYGTRYEDAVKAYKKAIQIKPDYAEAYYGLSKAYCGLEQYEKAIEALQQAIRFKPDYEEANNHLKELAQAIERLKRL